MIGLLDDRFVPLTDTIGFLRCPMEVAVAAFIKWQRAIQEERGVRLHERTVAGTFESLLRTLLPLTSVERRRFLFVSTNSDWTAFIDNGHHGTDAFPPISYLAQTIGCAGIRATDARPGTTQGGTIFEMYGHELTDWLNIERAIYAVPTDGRWSFGVSGTMLPFENPELYERKRIKDRFNSDMLNQYLREIGVLAFDAEFYRNEGTLVEKIGVSAPGMQIFDLAGQRLGLDDANP